MDDPRARLETVYDATSRYLQTVDTVTPEQLAQPSTLPGWSRAHVVAHVALNALGLARAFHGAMHGDPVPVYDSSERRNADIEATALVPHDELRELSFDACGRWRKAADALEDWSAPVRRSPTGQPLPARDWVDARWREVEIHHADLDLDFGPQDWSPEFAAYIFDVVVWDRGEEHDLTLHTPEGPVDVGAGGPVVEGSRTHLAWWLLGRGGGRGITGDLPTLGPWMRRTPAK